MSPIPSVDSLEEHGGTVVNSRIADFAAHDLDAYAIAAWANNPDEMVHFRRMQFLDTFPVLVPMLVFREDEPFSDEIIGWIDSGEPLIDNIASLFDVKKSTFQYLVGKPLSWISSRWIGDEMALAFAIDVPPPDKLPQSKSEWKIFSDFAEALMPVPWDASGYVFRELCVSGYESSYDEMLELAGGELRTLRLIWRYLHFLEGWLGSLIRSSRDTEKLHDAKSVVSEELPDDVTAVARQFTVRMVSKYSAANVFRQALDWQRQFGEPLRKSRH